MKLDFKNNHIIFELENSQPDYITSEGILISQEIKTIEQAIISIMKKLEKDILNFKQKP